MKHHQLINALENAGLQPDLHTISLLEVIQPLLGVPTPNDKLFPVITDELSEFYNSWIEQAGNYSISITSKHLKPLAEQCYQALVAQVHLQSRDRTA